MFRLELGGLGGRSGAYDNENCGSLLQCLWTACCRQGSRLCQDTVAQRAFGRTAHEHKDTSVRYTPGLGEPKDASRFLQEVKYILTWANSRI